MAYLVSILVNALAVIIVGRLLSGVEVKSFKHALMVAFLLGLLNTFIKPLLAAITFPLIILTLGLFILVINGTLVYVLSKLMDGFKVRDIWWAIGFSVFLSVVNGLLQWFLPIAP